MIIRFHRMHILDASGGEAQLRTVTAMGALDREQHVVELSEAIARAAALIDDAERPPTD